MKTLCSIGIRNASLNSPEVKDHITLSWSLTRLTYSWRGLDLSETILIVSFSHHLGKINRKISRPCCLQDQGLVYGTLPTTVDASLHCATLCCREKLSMALCNIFWRKVLCKAELALLRTSSSEPSVKKTDKAWISSLKPLKSGHQLLILEQWLSNYIMGN